MNMKQNIVILDGYTTNPGDLSWEPLENFGNLTVYDRTPHDLILERAKDAELLLTNKTVLDAETISSLPGLKYIGVLATGTNIVDLDAAKKRGITVTNIPSYSTDSVAQLVFALILSIIYHPEHYTSRNCDHVWTNCADFSYVDYPLFELAGKTLGIVGFGHIGQRVARIGEAFGMRIAVETSKPQESLPEGYIKLTREELFSRADVVTLHCPLAPDTEKMINTSLLEKMKPRAILINTGRGGLVDEAALADALRKGTIYAAGLDVLSQEPPKPDNPLLAAPHVLITPHIGWATREARKRLIDITAANISAFLSGEPINRV